MGLEELRNEFNANREEIRKVSHMIDNMNNQLQQLLDKDTDLWYQICKISNASLYGKTVERLNSHYEGND